MTSLQSSGCAGLVNVQEFIQGDFEGITFNLYVFESALQR